ncbi:MAG TPA: helix-turn-helix transcriptional regulator [Burkholderiaceae bacterium]|nr:helix-turn-helix transcriptional regulator [Burkholderiaceae bacterium]
MQELRNISSPSPGSATSVSDYRGPERRANASHESRCLSQMLDEIDYGMLLVEANGRLLHANHAARVDIEFDHPLVIVEGALRARCEREASILRSALASTADCRLRSFLSLGQGPQRITMSLIPLSISGTTPVHAALVVLRRRGICEALSVQLFARCHQLTLAESQVLRYLCAGAQPGEIALRQGVAISTVRTQLSSIRAKTGAASLRELVCHVSTLPPIVSAVRLATQASHSLAELDAA